MPPYRSQIGSSRYTVVCENIQNGKIVSRIPPFCETCDFQRGASRIIRVITDSTSSIPRSLREEHGIELFSLFVNHDGKEYKGSSMDLDEFYADIYEMADNIPTSSQPALSEIGRVFEDAAKAGDDVLGVFLSSKMSGTFESVVRAAKGAAERHASFRFAVIDSLTNCMELGWPVVSAAKTAASGIGLHECAQHVCERVRSTRFIFAPESLRFLEKGGRIGKASALLGNALCISPILTVKDGVASTYAKVRTQKKSHGQDGGDSQTGHGGAQTEEYCRALHWLEAAC